MADVLTPSGIPWYVPYKRTQKKKVYSSGSESSAGWSSFLMYHITSNSQYQVGEGAISTSRWARDTAGDGPGFVSYKRTQTYNRYNVTYPINMSSYSSVSSKVKSIMVYFTISGYSESAYDTYSYEISTKAEAGTALDYDQMKPDTNNSISMSFTGGAPKNVSANITSLGFTPYGYVIAAPNPRGHTFRNITISNFRIEVNFSNSIYINVGGSWREGAPYINVGGSWREGTSWVNVGGSWKEGSG